MEAYDALWYTSAKDRWAPYIPEHYSDSTGDVSGRRCDLDGDGALDTAFILSRKDSVPRDSTYALVVAFGNGRDTLLGVFSWAEAMGTIGVGLKTGPPGELRHLGGDDDELPWPTITPYTTLTLMYFEKSAVTWFWSDGGNGAVDLTYLDKFCEGDTVRRAKYISMFRNSVPGLVERLEAALDLGDAEELAIQVHGFKTKWMLMGMREAGELAQALENECRKEAPHAPTVVSQVHRLLVLLMQAQEELRTV